MCLSKLQQPSNPKAHLTYRLPISPLPRRRHSSSIRRTPSPIIPIRSIRRSRGCRCIRSNSNFRSINSIRNSNIHSSRYNRSTRSRSTRSRLISNIRSNIPTIRSIMALTSSSRHNSRYSSRNLHSRMLRQDSLPRRRLPLRVCLLPIIPPQKPTLFRMRKNRLLPEPRHS